MEENEDEPSDVRTATPVGETLGKINEKEGIKINGSPEFQKEKVRDSTKKEPMDKGCCDTKKKMKEEKNRNWTTVHLYEKEYKIPKPNIIPRHCLSKKEHLDMLATPSRKCDPSCLKKTKIRKVKPISLRITELAKPARQRILNTIEEWGHIVPPEFVDNLIRILEDQAQMTPEQAAPLFQEKRARGKNCRRKDKKKKVERKVNCELRERIYEEQKRIGNDLKFDPEAVCHQYQIAEKFIKSILDWKCLIPKEEYADISQIILKRLSLILEYTPTEDADLKSQQMRLVADMVSCWISGVILEVAEAHRQELEEECEKKRRLEEEETEEEEEEPGDDYGRNLLLSKQDAEDSDDYSKEEETKEEVIQEVQEEEEKEEEKNIGIDSSGKGNSEDPDEHRGPEGEGGIAVPTDSSEEEAERRRLEEEEAERKRLEEEEAERKRLEEEEAERKKLEEEEAERKRLEEEEAERKRLEEEEAERKRLEEEEAERKRLEEEEEEAERKKLEEKEAEKKKLEEEEAERRRLEEEAERKRLEEEAERQRLRKEQALESEKKVKAILTEKSTQLPNFKSDLPLITFINIYNTLYKMLEKEVENSQKDPVTNRLHRSIYEKFYNAVYAEDPALLTDKATDIIDVMTGKIAVWLRKFFSESQILLLNKYPPNVESFEIHDWAKWLMYVADNAGQWSSWIQNCVNEIKRMEPNKVTYEYWEKFTSEFEKNGSLWRRFVLDTVHKAHHNKMMIRDREVVKSGQKKIPEELEQMLNIHNFENSS